MTTVYWLCTMVLFLIVEAITTTLVSVWFAVGALAAAICSYFNVSTGTCVVVFAVVSAVSIVVFKKFYNKKLEPEHERTNADRLIGERGIADSEIDPVKGKGTVEVKGMLWSAKADEAIEKGDMVEVLGIEGVKLVVKKL